MGKALLKTTGGFTWNMKNVSEDDWDILADRVDKGYGIRREALVVPHHAIESIKFYPEG